MNRPNKKTIAKEDAKMIVRLLKECLGMSVKPCYTCGVSKWNTWVNKINLKYEQGNE